jgi:zinc-finger binding domain of transposase IS66
MNGKNENLVFLHWVLRTIHQRTCSNLGIRQPSSSWRTRSVSCSATSECSSKLHRIGEDVSEKLDVVPAQFRVLVVRRPKYPCRACEDVVVQSPAPARLIEGGLPTEATPSAAPLGGCGVLVVLTIVTGVIVAGGRSAGQSQEHRRPDTD